MTREQILGTYLQRGCKQVFYDDLLKVLIQTPEGDPYIENRSNLIYIQKAYIISYYKNNNEYKFNLFIRIKYNQFSKKVVSITVHIDDHKVNNKDVKILSTNILNILMAHISVCYNHLFRSALDIRMNNLLQW